MNGSTFLILHRKSANEPYIKEAVKSVKKAGIKLRVLVPFNKAEKPRVVAEALKRGATRIIAGGGDGTINAVANALIGKGKTKPDATLGVFPLGTANDFARGGGFDVAPNAKLDDGLLDLTAIMPGPEFNLRQMARELEDPMNADNKFVFYQQLSQFTMEADEPLHCNLDGEPVSKRRLTFKVLRQHLKVAF